jgi:hypothetical protein
MGTATDCLVVASIRQWVAREFAPAAERAGIPIVADLGLDVPALPEGCSSPAIWTPMEHAARLFRAGMVLPLSTPGPGWLPDLDRGFTGRAIRVGQLGDADIVPDLRTQVDIFAKAADMKVDRLPASRYPTAQHFVDSAKGAGLPPDSWIQVADDWLDLVEEHRCFVLDGLVVASSPYLVDGKTYEEGMEDDESLRHRDARKFAHEAVASVPGPAAFVVDVGFTSDGAPAVVEANPAWASNMYGADIDGVLATVRRACEPDQEWTWVPDPWLVAQAERKVILQRRRS